MRRTLSVFSALIIFSASLFANFDAVSDLDARGVALGGAVTALYDDANIVSDNAGALPFLEQGIVSLGAFPMHIGAEESFFSSFIGSAAMPFGKYGAVGLALNYFGAWADYNAMWQQFQTTLSYGIALPFFPAIGVGIGGRFQYWNVPSNELTEASVGDGMGKGTFNLNVGALYRITEEIAVGVSGVNLLGLNNAYDPGERNAIDRVLGAGISYHAKKLHLLGAFDFRYRIAAQALDISAGAEYTLFDIIDIRAGVEVVDVGNNVNLSFGAGYDIDAFTINLAYKHSISMGLFGSIMLSGSYRFDSPIGAAPERADAQGI